jgi:NADPH-dependent 2,4-dienoyl-CoA reductase/sulfur reductase-like enzyme
MPSYRYLIIGGGMTAASAIGGIREVDPDGTIGVIGTESHPPYDRPPLSKALWKGTPPNTIFRKLDPRGVTFHHGVTAQRLDLSAKRVQADDANTYSFDKLLLATGCTPRRFAFGDGQIIYFRTWDDYQQLRALADTRQHFLVVGGGFIGSEIAAALAMNHKEVTLIFPGPALCSRMFPKDLADFVTEYYRQNGVNVLAGTTLIDCKADQGRHLVTLVDPAGSARQVLVDGVVAGIGVLPNVALAQSAGLVVEDGIRVDASLRTSDPDVFAAGDVAQFHNPLLDTSLRVEHEDNANTMGRLAGQAMAGKNITYDHLPFFYSDLFSLGYEAIGQTDASLETFAEWKSTFREGVVYYLQAGRIRGVLLWGIFGQVDAARELLAAPRPFAAEDLKGRLPKA